MAFQHIRVCNSYPRVRYAAQSNQNCCRCQRCRGEHQKSNTGTSPENRSWLTHTLLVSDKAKQSDQVDLLSAGPLHGIQREGSEIGLNTSAVFWKYFAPAWPKNKWRNRSRSGVMAAKVCDVPSVKQIHTHPSSTGPSVAPPCIHSCWLVKSTVQAMQVSVFSWPCPNLSLDPALRHWRHLVVANDASRVRFSLDCATVEWQESSQCVFGTTGLFQWDECRRLSDTDFYRY